MKIFSVFGTRPEAIKMCPIVRIMNCDPKIESVVCVTAQHRSMLDEVLRVFDVVADYDLNLMTKNQTIDGITTKILKELTKILKIEKPDVVLVHGDTATCFSSSLAAFYLKIPVAHVEAGLRTYDIQSPFPEEGFRRMTDSISSLHFCPTNSSAINLVKEGIGEESIFVTGNTVIDSLLWAKNLKYKINKSLFFGNYQEIFKTERKLILVTGHRRESFGESFKNICSAIKKIALNNPKVNIVYPVHLNPNVRKPVYDILKNIPNVHLIDPLGYLDFVNLMKRSYIILTDSGGIQEEAPSLNKPTLVMRNKTERPEAISSGAVRLVGTNKNAIYREVERMLVDSNYYNEMRDKENPYGDGKASSRIVNSLKKYVS